MVANARALSAIAVIAYSGFIGGLFRSPRISLGTQYPNFKGGHDSPKIEHAHRKRMEYLNRRKYPSKKRDRKCRQTYK